jgi:aminoglycoside phosphotransferase
MNIVTDEVIELMAKYLKKLKSIDFTMCDLTEKQKENIKKKLPNVELCFEEEEDVNY